MNFTQALAGLTLGVAAFGASAQALDYPDFTWDPSKVSLQGGAVKADLLNVLSYTRLDSTPTTFSETGYLKVSSFELDGVDIIAPGLNSTYGLYFWFEGQGTSRTLDVDYTKGTFTSLTYKLFGYNGAPATFGFDASGNPTISGAAGAIELASGSLINGQGYLDVGPTSLGATAGADLTFSPLATAFFVDPTAMDFYRVAIASFTNRGTQQVVVVDADTVQLRGSGSVYFRPTPAVPEPATYAMMAFGLLAAGAFARSRKA